MSKGIDPLVWFGKSLSFGDSGNFAEMKSLLLGLHEDLHALREKLEHQCTVLSRQFTAVERLTNPCITLSNGSL